MASSAPPLRTPSSTGTSSMVTAYSGSPSPKKCDERLALMSLSPSQDREFIELTRQHSDASSSILETPKTPQHVTFETSDSLDAFRLPNPPSKNRKTQPTAERPITLDIKPRPRPTTSSILKKGVTPTPSESVGDDISYVSARSTVEETPPSKLERQATLLDLDVSGQKEDATKPIRPAKQETEYSRWN